MKMYHTTAEENVERILREGLKVGSAGGFTEAGSWADDIYGVRPIYLSRNPKHFSWQLFPRDEVILEIDIDRLDLVADLPSLVDHGANVDENGLWWEEGQLPEPFTYLLNDGVFYYYELIDPGNPAMDAAIETTGTAAILENVPPERIKILSKSKKQAYDIDKTKLRTLWYENEDGDIFLPDLESDYPADGIPEGFDYQLSQFPNDLTMTMLYIVPQDVVDACSHPEDQIVPTDGWVDGVEGRECKECGGSQLKDLDEEWLEEWDGGGCKEILRGNSSWSEDLVLAIANSGDFTLAEAVLICANACSRCDGVLRHDYGLDDGFEENSEGWENTNTECEFCRSID